MKQPSIAHVMLSLITIFLLAACTAQPTVTPLPSAQTQIVTSIPPTLTLEPTATLAPAHAPTALPSPTPIPLPTATAVPLTILSPAANAFFAAGSTITVQGIDETALGSQLTLSARIGDWLLAEAETAVSPDGGWETTLLMPPQISGPATITVQTEGSQQPVSVPINLQFETNADSTTLQFDRPRLGETAVAGHAIFFAGEINNPINRTLEIGVLHDNCTRFATHQVYELGNGQWRGMMILPSDITGNVCAIARTGNPDESETWLAALVPLIILSPDDENSSQIVLGNAGELVFSGSEPFTLFGTAVHATNNEVDILLNSDDGNYTLLASETVPVNSFGYWEIEITFDDSYAGFALLTVSTGSGDTYAELRIPLTFTR